MPVLKLTSSSVKALSLPADGQSFVFDTALKGFGIRLSRETKSFFAERRLHGKTKRITIGPYPIVTVEKARKTAQIILGELAQGIDRKVVEKAAQVKTVILSEVWTSFKEARKNLRPKTIDDYDKVLNRAFPDWLKKPWVSVTNAKVAKRHAELGKSSGPGYANLAMRVLSALVNYARRVYTDADGEQLIAQSPIAILSTTGAWYKLKPKKRIIKLTQLPEWWKAVESLNNKTAADYLKVLLLTGLRRGEAAGLRWEDVDLAGKTLTVRDTKNHTDHTLPLSDFLFELLEQRKQGSGGTYVFPGDGASGHLGDVKKAVAHVVRTSNIQFSPHDLRRTFITTAHSLDLSAYTVKKLANHSMSGDVTAEHYIVFDIERLRDAMEKIDRFLLRHAGAIPTADVVQLTATAQAA